MSGVVLLRHQVRLNQKQLWRAPDAVIFTVAMPVVLLLVLGATSFHNAPPQHGVRAIELFAMGLVAIGIITAAFQNLAVSVTVAREEGTFKRIQATPVPRWVVLGGLVSSSLAVAALLVVTILVLGRLVFGVSLPVDRLGAVTLVSILGVLCFASLSLAVTAMIPTADAAGPVTNALYLPLAIVSGAFFPIQHLPAWLHGVTGTFPIGRLVDALRRTVDPTIAAVSISDLAILAGWALVGAWCAARWFRWHPKR